jgi:hypothetical protein
MSPLARSPFNRPRMFHCKTSRLPV